MTWNKEPNFKCFSLCSDGTGQNCVDVALDRHTSVSKFARFKPMA